MYRHTQLLWNHSITTEGDMQKCQRCPQSWLKDCATNAIETTDQHQEMWDNHYADALTKFCGRNHERKKLCPAWGQVCSKCRGKNHFAKTFAEDSWRHWRTSTKQSCRWLRGWMYPVCGDWSHALRVDSPDWSAIHGNATSWWKATANADWQWSYCQCHASEAGRLG